MNLGDLKDREICFCVLDVCLHSLKVKGVDSNCVTNLSCGLDIRLAVKALLMPSSQLELLGCHSHLLVLSQIK